MSYIEQPFLFFIKCPNLKNLLSFSVELFYDKQGEGFHLFHRRILKCRELIFSESEIVATPTNYSASEILAIIPKNRFFDEEFKKKLYKMGLNIVKVGDASPILLQECLQYTVMAKIAPQWNNVQNLLVKGRDFLMASNPLKAIKLDIFVNGDEITLSLTPKCIKLPHFKIENFVKAYEISENTTIIEEICHVLPSLKKGKAISLSKSGLTTNLFKTYSDLKKHWKNMYGYRLPEIPEENVWYMTVVFNVPFSTPYTYPSFCVRPFGLIEVQQKEPQLALQTFISDFCKKVGNICNEKCQILDLKASFPSLHLYPAEDVIKDAIPRTGTTYTMPYRSATVMHINNEKLVNKSQNGINAITKTSRENKSIAYSSNLFSMNTLRNSGNNFNDKNFSIPCKKIVFGQTENSVSFDRGALDTLCRSSFQNDKRNPNKRNKENYLGKNFLDSAKDNVDSERASNSSDNNLTIQMSSGDKNILQAKYTPNFVAKKPKQQVQSLLGDAFPKVKSAKYAPNICANKVNRIFPTPGEIQRLQFNLKSNSDQMKFEIVNGKLPSEMGSSQKLLTEAKASLDEKTNASKQLKGKNNSLQSKTKRINIDPSTIKKRMKGTKTK